MADFSVTHTLKCPKTREQNSNDKKFLKLTISLNFEHSPIPPRLQSQTKTIEHATKCDAFIISSNSNRNHSFTCPKTWGKRLKIPENDHFSLVLALHRVNLDHKAK